MRIAKRQHAMGRVAHGHKRLARVFGRAHLKRLLVPAGSHNNDDSGVNVPLFTTAGEKLAQAQRLVRKSIAHVVLATHVLCLACDGVIDHCTYRATDVANYMSRAKEYVMRSSTSNRWSSTFILVEIVCSSALAVLQLPALAHVHGLARMLL